MQAGNAQFLAGQPLLYGVCESTIASLPHPLAATPPSSDNLFTYEQQTFTMSRSTSLLSRHATHAGTWYSDDDDKLSNDLDSWLNAVPEPVKGIGSISKQEPPISYPVPGAKVIIAPYALRLIT
jgi:hypothetical protein